MGSQHALCSRLGTAPAARHVQPCLKNVWMKHNPFVDYWLFFGKGQKRCCFRAWQCRSRRTTGVARTHTCESPMLFLLSLYVQTVSEDEAAPKQHLLHHKLHLLHRQREQRACCEPGRWRTSWLTLPLSLSPSADTWALWTGLSATGCNTAAAQRPGVTRCTRKSVSVNLTVLIISCSQPSLVPSICLRTALSVFAVREKSLCADRAGVCADTKQYTDRQKDIEKMHHGYRQVFLCCLACPARLPGVIHFLTSCTPLPSPGCLLRTNDVGACKAPICSPGNIVFRRGSGGARCGAQTRTCASSCAARLSISLHVFILGRFERE